MARHLSRRYVRILAYHGVDPSPDPLVNFDGFQVAPDVFRRQMDLLAGQYTIWPLSRIVQGFLDGSGLPDRLVALTFDDGYRNNLLVAAPILKEYGFPATFFVTTGFIDGTHRPWWYQLRTALAASRRPSVMSPAGVTMELGPRAKRIRAMLELERELKNLDDGKREETLTVLMNALGVDADEYPYPFMNWSEVKALAEAGFDIGPHTVSHINLAAEKGTVAICEVRQSLRRVREMTGCDARIYSYPYGGALDGTSDVREVFSGEGVLGAVTTVSGMNDRSCDLYRLKRLNITGNHGVVSFDALMSGLRSCLGPLT